MNTVALGLSDSPLQAGKVDPDRNYDPLLLVSVVALISLGIVMVFSATIATDSHTLDTSYHHLTRHLIHISLGAMLLFAASRVRIEWLQNLSKPLLFLGLVLLVVLLFPGVGVEVNGSLRWFDIGGLRFQPSEFIKVVSIIYFADYLARKKDDLHLFKVGIINVGVVVGAIGLLLLMEPDFGTTVVIMVTVAAMMFLAGVRFWHFFISLSVAAGLMAAIVWMEPYRVARLMSYRDPWADPFGSGFQLVQALIAIGRGEWFGTGLGSSIQKLFYLPHAGNDFLIAVIGEELGAIGIFGVLTLYAIFVVRAFVISRRALKLGQRFAGSLAQGIAVLVSFQALVHIGVNTGLLPTKGLTLPLMSYGGSSILCTMLAMGLLLAVDRQSRPRTRGRG